MGRTNRRLSAAAALALAFAGAAHAEPGDPQRGRIVVEHWCAQCHAQRGVETDPDRAPTFEEIAARPGRDARYLRRFLDRDHFPMTTYRLFNDEKRDVAAFIAALQRD